MTADAPPRASSRGCLAYVIASCLLGALGLWLGIFGLLYHFRGYLGPVKDAAGEALRARSAPGTNEVRALGCEEAMAMDGAKFSASIEALIAEHARRAGQPVPPPTPALDMTFVICQNQYGPTPTCDAVAAAYAAAVPGERRFAAMVQQLGQEDCANTYAGDGTLLGPLNAPTPTTTPPG